MSTINDAEDTLSTISDLTSVRGTSGISEKMIQEENRKLREENERLRRAQEIPTWVTSETEAVDQSWDGFRRTFGRIKERIVQHKSMEGLSGNYKDMKESAKINDDMVNAWMSAADNLKKYIGELESKLKASCNLDDETDEISQDFPENVDNSKLEINQDKPIDVKDDAVDDNEFYPPLNERTEKECDLFVGTMHRSKEPITNERETNVCAPEELPLKISIKKLK